MLCLPIPSDGIGLLGNVLLTGLFHATKNHIFGVGFKHTIPVTRQIMTRLESMAAPAILYCLLSNFVKLFNIKNQTPVHAHCSKSFCSSPVITDYMTEGGFLFAGFI